MVPTGLESRCLQDCVPSGGSRVEFRFLPFPASGGTCTPWLTAPSSIFKARSTTSSNLSLSLASASVVSSPPHFPSLTLLPCCCRDTYAYIGPMQISQAHLPISGSLTQSHLQKWHIHRCIYDIFTDTDMGTWTSLRELFGQPQLGCWVPAVFWSSQPLALYSTNSRARLGQDPWCPCNSPSFFSLSQWAGKL